MWKTIKLHNFLRSTNSILIVSTSESVYKIWILNLKTSHEFFNDKMISNKNWQLQSFITFQDLQLLFWWLLGRRRRRYPSLDAFADLAAPTEEKRLAVPTLRPTHGKTKASDEVAPSRGLVQREGPRRIRPIVIGPARLSALRARFVKAFL